MAEPPERIDPDDIITEAITEAEAAAICRVTVATLRTWRSRRRGPPHIKIGRKVFYRRSAVTAWIARQERDPEGSAPTAVARTGRRLGPVACRTMGTRPDPLSSTEE